MVSSTSARPSGGRDGVPAKMTSDMVPPRSALAPCSPRTQAMASTTLLLPEPFGPTTQVIPGSRCRVVELANDLKPRRVRLLRCTGLRQLSQGTGRGQLAAQCHRRSGPPCVRRPVSAAMPEGTIGYSRYCGVRWRTGAGCGGLTGTGGDRDRRAPEDESYHRQKSTELATSQAWRETSTGGFMNAADNTKGRSP